MDHISAPGGGIPAFPDGVKEQNSQRMSGSAMNYLCSMEWHSDTIFYVALGLEIESLKHMSVSRAWKNPLLPHNSPRSLRFVQQRETA